MKNRHDSTLQGKDVRNLLGTGYVLFTPVLQP